MMDWKAALRASTATPIMHLDAKEHGGGWWVVAQAGSRTGDWLICDAYTRRPNINQPKAITADDAIAECMFLLTKKIKDWRNSRARVA